MDIDKINENARSEVMNDSIRIRISVPLKRAFMNECADNGVDSSSIIRALIRDYIEESQRQKK